MNQLYFEKISSLDRIAEPVTVSIPFRQGTFQSTDTLLIRNGSRVFPTQVRVLAKWPDGSAKWLLTHFQADLPGNKSHTLEFEKGSAPSAGVSIKLEKNSEGIAMDTGVLQFVIPQVGFFPFQQIHYLGKSIAQGNPFQGFFLRLDRRSLSASRLPVEIEVVEAGPLRVEILVRGNYADGENPTRIRFVSRIVAYAGKPYVHIDHQIINAELSDKVELQEFSLDFKTKGQSWKGMIGTGTYVTNFEKTQVQTVTTTLNSAKILSDAAEHHYESYYGDFVADWCDARGGCAVTQFQAYQNFPKSFTVGSDGITVGIYPKDEPPATLYQGVAKTHRFQLFFHQPDATEQEIAIRSLQFQIPDRPALSPDWYRANDPWNQGTFPGHIPNRLLSVLMQIHDAPPKALGMLHFGDAPDEGYTAQGRGHGKPVWVNNEYDRPHACALFYALTGIRRAFDSCLAGGQHQIDVDFCHYHPDPLIHGGQSIHTVEHVVPRLMSPSHEWVEGVFDLYHFTGRIEAREAAVSIAENVLYHITHQPHFQGMGDACVREFGWALRTFTAMSLITNEPRWRKEAGDLAKRLYDAATTAGSFLSPYTSHSAPRAGFMVALTANSLAKYSQAYPDPKIDSVVVAIADDLIEHGMGPDGIFYYKELPSLKDPFPSAHVIEMLVHAYRISGGAHYLQIATDQFAALMVRFERGTIRNGGATRYTDEPGAVVLGKGDARVFADHYIPLILYGGAAEAAGMLDWYEYPGSRLRKESVRKTS